MGRGGNTFDAGALPTRLVGFDAPTVWHEFTPLSNKLGAINLGQGFPDWEPPSFVVEAAEKAFENRSAAIQQYSRPGGHLRLAKAVASTYSPLLGIELDPMKNIHITVSRVNAANYCCETLESVGLRSASTTTFSLANLLDQQPQHRN